MRLGPKDVETSGEGAAGPVPEGQTVGADGERDPFLAPRYADASADDLYDGDW